MMTAHTALRSAATPEIISSRRRRRLQRQRLLRQELMALAFLAAALAATLVLLGLQWLDAGTPPASSLHHLSRTMEVASETVWS